MKMNVCRLKSQTEKLDQVSVSVHDTSMQLCQQWQMLLKHIAAGFRICHTDPTMRKIYTESRQKQSFTIALLALLSLQISAFNVIQAEIPRLKVGFCFFSLQEKQRMTDKLEDTSLRLKDEMDLYRKIMDKLWHNRHAFQKEKESMQEVRQPT